MASYHDAYDSRARPSRRDDSYSSRPRYDDYLKPTAGAREPSRRVGETSIDGQNNDYRKQRSPNRHARDSRYDDYPPPLPPDSGRPPPRRTASTNRRRSTWPPKATCEDEVTSLAKEAGSKRLLNEIKKDEAQSRGTIDQEPVLLDVPEFINKDERRFVFGQGRPASDLPTPPTSEDEKSRKARRKPSKIDIGFDKLDNFVPEMNKRTATPYSFQPNRTSKDDLSHARFLSPDSLLSPPSTGHKSHQSGSKSQPSSPRRDSARYSPSLRKGDDYFSLSASDCAIDDTSDDARDRRTRRDDNKPKTYPPSRDSRDAPNSSPQTSVVDFAPQPSSVPIRKLNIDARRNTDTEGTLPTMRKLRADNTRGPTPLMTSALSNLAGPVMSSPQTMLAPADFPLPRSRGPGASPAGSVNGDHESTSQRSPRVSADFSRDGSISASPTGSRAGSVTDSRPQSPSPRTPTDGPRLPKTDLDWSALLAANASRRPKALRPTSSLRQETMPATSRTDIRRPYQSSRHESLPYPMDDGPSTPSAWMPSERTHQYFPDTKPSLQPVSQEAKTTSRAASPAPGSSNYLSANPRPTRPSFQSRHSTADLPQSEARKQPERPRPAESRRISFNGSSQAKKDLQALLKKGLPTCPRTKPVAGYSDWYTIIGAPSLDFCPSCVDSVERTVFRNAFRRSPPMSLETRVQCALGGAPWIRLAWLLTLQQQKTDLRLLVDIAEIEETSVPCSGDLEAARTWFSLRDTNGMFVKDFRICYSDVRKIECLLPSLSGMFVRLPSRTSDEMGMCAIRPEGNRFSIYIDALISTHEKAMAARAAPSPSPFISLVQWRSRLRECSKDNLLRNGLWHFIPGLEAFSVCEDCFETVVEPEVQKSNDLALRFNRSIQPIYGEGVGSSCQLYSTRMRKVFARAIQDRDLKYLSRKARERREAELRLQEKYKHVIQKAKRLSWESGTSSEDDERRLDREIRKITDEWQNEWE